MQVVTIKNSNITGNIKDDLLWPIRRRNYYSGTVSITNNENAKFSKDTIERWHQNEPIYLPYAARDFLSENDQYIQQSAALYQAVLEDQDIVECLEAQHYQVSLSPNFELLSSRYDASDEQEIVSIDFDAYKDDRLIEDIWMRISWLSYSEQDASLRFRFSFGMEGYEDVSQDVERQLLAAQLEESIFPESRLITKNPELTNTISQLIGSQNFQYLERIVYFNAPNGGAQFHHDAEKGHLGVVYAQVSGKTFWLALSKKELIKEVQCFLANQDNFSNIVETLKENPSLNESVFENLKNESYLDKALNDLFHPELMLLLNENKLFFQQLVSNGYAYYLEPGDVILLPQESINNCAWHSVFCVGEEAGEALSFAIKCLD